MIPATVNVLEQCLKDDDEENASKIFEVFDTLLMLVRLVVNRMGLAWMLICVMMLLGCPSFVEAFG